MFASLKYLGTKEYFLFFFPKFEFFQPPQKWCFQVLPSYIVLNFDAIVNKVISKK